MDLVHISKRLQVNIVAAVLVNRILVCVPAYKTGVQRRPAVNFLKKLGKEFKTIW